jgi:hypothetical protein
MADHIFVSYAHEDRSRVEPFAGLLRQQGWAVFLDDQIPGAGQWPAELHKAIRTSRVVIVMLSPDAMNSTHVLNEINVALGTGRAIVPVMLEDTVLSPGVELLIGSRQSIDYAEAATWQFEDVVDAVQRAFHGSQDRRDRKAMKVIGNLIAGLGLIVIIAGMGLFFFGFYKAVSNPDPFARLDSQQMGLSFIIFFVGMIVGGIGEAIRRATKRRF